MSEPDPDRDIEREALYQYCWQRNQLAARIHALTETERKAEVALFPFVDDKSARLVSRPPQLIEMANKYLQWDDLDATNKVCDQIDGALGELKSLLREHMPQFVERVLS
jgi:hypothetical protein